jgi:hypothetical protein
VTRQRVVLQMYTGWFARLFFAVVAALGVGAIVSGTACTRWGHPGAVPPTITPISAIYVSAKTGSDTSGSGTMASPYKTVTKAVMVVDTAKSISPMGVTIHVESGNYDKANGEIFPVVVTKSVTITGMNYGRLLDGSFLNGLGEDTTFEQIAHAPKHSAYATLVVAPPASLSLGAMYVGATNITLPNSTAFYASLDVLASATASGATLGAGIVSTLENVNGILVAGGTLTCTSCAIRGNDFGIFGLSVPLVSPTGSPSRIRGAATASPSPSPSAVPSVPTITLSHTVGDSTIVAKVANVITDGSIDVVASGESFERAEYAFTDALKPIVPVTIPGAVDFGGGFASSSGGNAFIGARMTEIYITRRNATVYALDNVWNPSQQGANRSGRYPRRRRFAAPSVGRNVTIRSAAVGSTVLVGPAPIPTPTPSVSPSGSPVPTTSPT